jgi:hypothetical protein
LELIEACNLINDALIFNADAGATTLIAHLLVKVYENIVVKDIAAIAINNMSRFFISLNLNAKCT